ncbi:hypothetical protein ACOJBM_40630 [Rhizobium beringeri]
MINRRTFLTLASAIACMRGIDAGAAIPLRLVFIHGRSQQGLDPVVLKKTWSEALVSALAIQNLKLPTSLDIEFPYYGDALDKFVSQSKIQVASQVHARGSDQQDDFLAFQAQVANELVVNAGVTDAQIDAEYGNNPKTRGPLNWEWVQSILQALDKHGGGLSADAIEAFTRDVYLYLTSELVRTEIDKIVMKSMNGEPTIVVGHSLGSVVAYNVLKTNPGFKVPMLVTIGSPLGIRAIRTPLSPIGFQKASPAGLTHMTPATSWRSIRLTAPISLFGRRSKTIPVSRTAPPTGMESPDILVTQQWLVRFMKAVHRPL